jgi:integrase
MSGRLFLSFAKNGVVWGEGLTEKVVWYVVKNFARTVGIEKVTPDDLRRTCARLCHGSGGELEQIQFLLGHVSVQTCLAPAMPAVLLMRIDPGKRRSLKMSDVRPVAGTWTNISN